jgi:hypothetical protein
LLSARSFANYFGVACGKISLARAQRTPQQQHEVRNAMHFALKMLDLNASKD